MMNGNEEEAAAKPSKQPRYTKLTQQELDACKPVLDATWAVFIFSAIAFIMIPVGVVCLVYGMKPIEIAVPYETECLRLKNIPKAQAEQWLWDNQRPVAEGGIKVQELRCLINITVTRDMKWPIYVYYELDGVYQNHRRYVKSRSDVQLKGETVSNPEKDLAACEPQLFYQVSTGQYLQLPGWFGAMRK
jgi:hypothetical protein